MISYHYRLSNQLYDPSTFNYNKLIQTKVEIL